RRLFLFRIQFSTPPHPEFDLIDLDLLPMAAGGCARLRRGGSRGIAGGLVVRRPRAQIHGGRKLRGRGSIGKVGGADERELGAHGGRIEQAEGELYAPDSEEEEADMETKDVLRKERLR
ncbi:unnamed protein product, partial [Urochloa humidicola]